MTVQRGRDGVNEPPYTGALGSTRRETALIPTPEGTNRRVEILKSVNAVTDPALARQAVDGTLHRYGDVDLAVPFVYHDPASRRFLLVIPVARAHEELHLRAELLLKLAADTAELLPGYVREARSAVGAVGLRKLLEEVPSRASVAPPSQDLLQREDRVARRAQELTAREGAINARSEELDAVQNDLAVREQELEQRVAEVMAREETLAQDEQVMRANMAALASREKRLQALDDEISRREQAVETAPLDDGPPPQRAPATAEATSDDAMELDPEEQTGRLRTVGPAQESVMEAAFEPEPEGEELLPDEVALVEDSRPDPEATALWVAHGGRSWVAVVEGEVRLWTQSSPETAHEITAASAIPVLQCDPDGLLPVALLSVRTESGHTLTRVGVDYTRPEDRGVLDALTRDFRVRVEVMSPAGRAIGSQVIGAPCEENARRVLDLLAERPSATADDRQTAIGHMVADGLKWPGSATALPDSAFEQEFETAETVSSLMSRYEPLLESDQLHRLAVASGRSSTQIEALGKRLILAALRCGITLSPRLIDRAVKVGIAPDERSLAQRALTAFSRTVEGGLGAVGRTPAEASRAWRPLLEWAERAGVTANDSARAAVAAVYNPDEPGATPPPETRASPASATLPLMSDAELTGWTDHRDTRVEATRLLIARDVAAHTAAIIRALNWMQLSEAATVTAEILAQGDAAGDLWIELLSSPRRSLAALAAVGCAVIKQRRALNTLIQRGIGKDDDDWHLFGWAAGEFGPALVRALGRLDGAPIDRLSWMLGHAVRAGASRELERSRPGFQGVLAEASSRCLAIQDQVQAYDLSLRQGRLDGAVERACAALLSPASTATAHLVESLPRSQ